MKLIRIKEQELKEKNEQIKLINNQLQENDNIINKDTYYDIRNYLITNFLHYININYLPSASMTRRYFREKSKDFAPYYLARMQYAGFVDTRNELTLNGLEFIRQIAKESNII